MYGLVVVRAHRGSYPVFADVRVGVMRVMIQGQHKATQLSVVSPRGNRTTQLGEGDNIDLHGTGWLTVRRIEGGDSGIDGWVVMEFRSSATGPAA